MTGAAAQPVGVAVVGVGAMGRVHLEAFATDPRTRVVSVCDAAPDVLADVTRAHPDTTATASIESIVDNAAIDLVSVCLPHRDHVPTAIRLLEAGKWVILEKPVAVDLADARRLLRVTDHYPGRLVVKSYLRHSAPFQHFRRVVTERTIGDPVLAVATFASLRRDADVPEWRLRPELSGGGALLDSGIHLVDVLHWCFGEERAVEALARYDDSGLDLNTVVIMNFEPGPIATVAVTQSSARRGPHYRLELFGLRGRVVVEPDAEGSQSCVTDVDGVLTTVCRTPNWWLLAHRAALSHYVNRFLCGGPLGEPPAEAVANLATIAAAYDLDRPRPV